MRAAFFVLWLMISLETNIKDFRKQLRTLPDYADRLLFEAVEDGIDYGQHRMKELVPRDKDTLHSAVLTQMHWMVGGHHFEGEVYVNPFIAPHGRFVDEGTGVDGPFARPVYVKQAKAMTWIDPERGRVYHKVVKIHPSSKIERGKNFSGRTYDSMKHWTAVRTSVITSRLATHLAREN